MGVDVNLICVSEGERKILMSCETSTAAEILFLTFPFLACLSTDVDDVVEFMRRGWSKVPPSSDSLYRSTLDADFFTGN